MSDTGGIHNGLLGDFTAGRRAALARVISIVENQRDGFHDLLNALHPRIGRSHRIGITGPPGAGKSTLTAALIAYYRSRNERVGVIAVDPTSPFTGGALLGDRIRMNEISMDEGVFIRSMATRGSLGGLALATKEIADVMDAFGFERLIVETVGVGQSELDIAAAADSTVVVLVPESGDSIQAMKAGLMEAADLFVINKADRPGADRLAREVSSMLHFRSGQALRNVPAHHGVDMKRVSAKRAAAKAAEARVRAKANAAGNADAAGNVDAAGNANAAANADSAGNANADTAGNDDVQTPGAWEIPVLKTIAETGEGVSELAEVLERHVTWLNETGEMSRRRRQRLAERVREEVSRSVQRSVWQERGGAEALEKALPDLEAGRVTPYDVAALILRGNDS
ncbi:MAG: methylmalonyl Co-A mutase-associated GTPase MeaB [Gemmatimonadetes bacterium]|nr:methylmalonyl Co-A mutase-associated GTPase MeaB [Gemmatimonadota bacterium]